MQMLDPTAITPLYVQLMNMIEEDVSAGRYHTGDRLMTEKEMAETYHISINTVRRAIDKLIEKGLVERKQGKGTFVTKTKFERNMKKLQSFTELCHQIGVKPGGKMLENKVVTADEKTARRLDIPVGSRVVFLSRVRYADQEPVVIEGNYFPMEYSFLLDNDFDNNSLFDFIEEKTGKRIASSEKRIELCRATAHEGELLRVKKGEYLLYVKSTAYDTNGIPMYVGTQLINGERFSLYVYESAI